MHFTYRHPAFDRLLFLSLNYQVSDVVIQPELEQTIFPREELLINCNFQEVKARVRRLFAVLATINQ